jgi:hypothetical protein
VLIGQRWRGVQTDGSSRISMLDDFVRREVRQALERRITTIPVLIEGVGIHELQDLPAELALIRSRNAHLLRPDPDFGHDMERLTSFILKRLS